MAARAGLTWLGVLAAAACTSAETGQQVAPVESESLLDIVGDTPVEHLPVPAADVVGALAGDASVQGGAATYAIAIEVPPGRRGMQPPWWGYQSCSFGTRNCLLWTYACGALTLTDVNPRSRSRATPGMFNRFPPGPCLAESSVTARRKDDDETTRTLRTRHGRLDARACRLPELG